MLLGGHNATQMPWMCFPGGSAPLRPHSPGRFSCREQPIFSTRAHVFQIDPATKRNWIPASKHALTVSYFYDATRNVYRIISVGGTKVGGIRWQRPAAPGRFPSSQGPFWGWWLWRQVGRFSARAP